jgi:CheY-like chemotaxis protein
MQLKDTRILIVEDEIVVASEIKLRLENMGYTVLGIVNSGLGAIQRTETLEPDIILMDITLKGNMTGLEASREIAKFSDTPVIFITAHTDKPTLDSAKEVSSHGIFTKPFSDIELQAAIQQALISTIMKNFLDNEDEEDL